MVTGAPKTGRRDDGREEFELQLKVPLLDHVPASSVSFPDQDGEWTLLDLLWEIICRTTVL